MASGDHGDGKAMARQVTFAWRGMRILHAALCASVAMYGVVLVAIQSSIVQAAKTELTGHAAAAPQDPRVLVAALGAVALIDLAIVVPLLRRRMLPARGTVPPTMEATPLDDFAVVEKLAPRLGAIRKGMLVTWAACEAAAMFGFVAAVVTHEIVYFVPFAVAGLGALIACAPTRRLALAFAQGA